jgi:hypothetical protein
MKGTVAVVLFYLLKVRHTVHEHHMKLYKGSGHKAICRDEGSVHFTPWARPLGSHAIGYPVGPTMHVVAKYKIIVVARNQTLVIQLAVRHFEKVIPANTFTIFYIFTH